MFKFQKIYMGKKGKRPEYASCEGFARLELDDPAQSVDPLKDASGCSYSLESYRPGTIYVTDDGSVRAFRPEDDPNVLYVEDGKGLHIVMRNPTTGQHESIQSFQRLSDLLVDEADPDAWRVANRFEK